MNPILESGLGMVLGTGLGMATAGWQDRRQITQQRKLQNMQVKGQKEMAEYNRELAMQMWKDTNYSAQAEEMRKAGLNVGLMYGMGGGGGTTAHTSPGSVTGGTAPSGGGEPGMGMQLGLQAAMMQSQIELTKAQTEKTKTEAQKLGGTDTTESQARTANIIQSTKNAALDEKIKEYQVAMTEIEKNIQAATANDIVKQIQMAAEKAEGEAQQALINGNILEATRNEVIQQIKQNTLEQQLRMSAQKIGIQATQKQIEATAQQIVKMRADIRNEQQRLGQTDQEIQIKQKELARKIIETEFGTNTPKAIEQWVDALIPIF